MLLRDFSNTLGSSYREEQLRCCDYYIARLVPLCERLRTELPKRLRLAWILPLAVAGALILLRFLQQKTVVKSGKPWYNNQKYVVPQGR